MGMMYRPLTPEKEEIMRRNAWFVALALCLSLFAAPAFAAGPYFAVEGGVLWLSDSSFDVAGFNLGDIEFDTGWGIGLAGGYDFGTYRLELEVPYRSTDVDKFTDSTGSTSLSGDVSSTALMVNAFYDFRMISPAVVPYLGAGIGAAYVTADVSDDVGQVLDDDDTVFAYQFIAGVAFPVSKQLAIDVNYRYFATDDPNFEISNSGGLSGDAEYSSHNVFVGLRFNF